MTVAVSGFSQFAAMRADSESDPKDPATLREVASQFEALFIETLMKNMRAAQLSDPLFGDSDQQAMYQEMMDQQLAKSMSSGAGLGLADMLVSQLGGEAQPVAPTVERFSVDAIPGNQQRSPTQWDTPNAFVRDVWPHAERVAERLGLAPEALMAQAALETGWGAHILQRDNGASSYNLFGIKAGNDWSGGSVARPTVEYVDGVAERRVERFRAYTSLSSAFDDYASLIQQHSRYSDVRQSGTDIRDFAAALQQAGYATDPLYAAKIERVHGSETMRTAIASLKIH